MEGASRIDNITKRTIEEMKLYTNFSVLSDKEIAELYSHTRKVVESSLAMLESRGLDDEKLYNFVATVVFTLIGIVRNDLGLDKDSVNQN